jgi:hypothetical protein
MATAAVVRSPITDHERDRRASEAPNGAGSCSWQVTTVTTKASENHELLEKCIHNCTVDMFTFAMLRFALLIISNFNNQTNIRY